MDAASPGRQGNPTSLNGLLPSTALTCSPSPLRFSFIGCTGKEAGAQSSFPGLGSISQDTELRTLGLGTEASSAADKGTLEIASWASVAFSRELKGSDWKSNEPGRVPAKGSDVYCAPCTSALYTISTHTHTYTHTRQAGIILPVLRSYHVPSPWQGFAEEEMPFRELGTAGPWGSKARLSPLPGLPTRPALGQAASDLNSELSLFNCLKPHPAL